MSFELEAFYVVGCTLLTIFRNNTKQ